VKKTSIPRKPTAAKAPARSADDWVTRGSAPSPEPKPPAEAPKPEKPPTTRYTIDIPTTLHAQIKIKCAQKGMKMNEEIIKLLEKHFSS